MRTVILKRLLHLVPLLLGVSLLTFLVMHAAPGDYLDTMRADPAVSPEAIEAMRTRFGLDQPLPLQYLSYLKNVFLRLDFGYSFAYHRPVFEVLAQGLLNTFVLALAGSCVAWGLSIPLGILSAVRHNTWVDRACSFVAFVGLSVPEVFLALLLLLFAARTGWFPIGGMRSLDSDSLGWGRRALDLLHHLVLPALAVGLAPMASRMRQMRANLLDVLHAEYVTTARAKGLPESAVVLRHAVRNALNPLITLFGYSLGFLLTGSFLVEVVMGWPGLGRLTLTALLQRDLYVVMGSVLLTSGVLVLGNLAADLLLVLADPRIRAESA
ncbi:MAG TPA: ABC transporter permease [Candidatus Saccharimonadales bacterium]|nr:ABC transporter permease [Candidatus Saccharimonadales bacterium]